ncbi:methyltransferase [Nocardia sp. NPDC005978]|uniref:methyltransferase n=1 Tax=Nocardia sp. NPDC005978 TaxID=3156725 RepID=UPI00339E5843
MTRSLAVPSRMDSIDSERFGAAVRFVRTHDTAAVLAEMLPELTAAEHAAVAGHCTFAHTAVLVFPEDAGELDKLFTAHGLVPVADGPSTVVRRRLAVRHGVRDDRLPVRIVRADIPAADGNDCEIEVFVLMGQHDQIAAVERADSAESHLALATGEIDDITLNGLRAVLTGRGKMRSDGGGYNPHEDATILYFACTSGRALSYRRLELHVAGHHPEVLGTHLGETQESGHRLLRLLTGAWTTQALAVTAELGIADRLAVAPGLPVAELATLTGTDSDALGRLLRYLHDLEVVEPAGPGFALTDTGALLANEREHSLHALARLYGGAFYESFGALDFAVRTGNTAFDEHFGRHHFEYFAADPKRAALFDSAMAASAAIFGRVGHLIDTAAAHTVVDVGGGNGELLARVLSVNPELRGVLFERESTLDRARVTFERADVAGRCELVAGDFFGTAVPSGSDIYLLSRVLHDWADAECDAILRRCAAAMTADAQLYIIERLLPEDDSRSLTPAWDLHMLCNVGGRERTTTQFRELLGAVGLEITTCDELPLGFALLRVRHTRTAR